MTPEHNAPISPSLPPVLDAIDDQAPEGESVSTLPAPKPEAPRGGTGKRRSGRELAFRLLFEIDQGGASPAEVFRQNRIVSQTSAEVWFLATELARGAWEHRSEIDPIIVRYASGWTLERMANADRNLLRLALFEMLHRDDIPRKVSINEAVEMAKAYSTADSGKFINGILGSFAREKPEN